MTMCTVLPWIVEPDFVIELETITAMNAGSGPGGGFALLPGPVVQFVPHVTLAGFFSKPLNEAGALPPVRLFSIDHCAPQKVTEVPIAALLSPITKLPPLAKTQKTNVEVEELSRIEQAAAFLALLELRRANQILISQAAPFAPIRVSRVEEESVAVNERTHTWNVRSA